ncbi:leishmanolysin-related zinc metalloendopeptidase [Actibacterium sp. 188UL27-1]|uniref:leishmanolysin-related zinc metalloendopeptidase n=1 Tax=Actibacterium sp. 188UL27-1 TaxID=2786961 RepID=UPI001959576D|nr:leishmanolysin-related zinc metalloendopeptidase [Actibacterium sp. 188UL27-1]MBM7069891.1 hypothetical protein [Actibacterium sp. 188UL27-1]
MITVRYISQISEGRQRVFDSAAGRWDRLIDTSYPALTVNGEVLDGILIEASIVPIDGATGVLGQAGPTILRPGGVLPAQGVMQFDVADVERLEQTGSFEDVVLHEMAHVLGFGTLWQRQGLVNNSGTNNPIFVGDAARQEYAALSQSSRSGGVPVANTGGAGTREGHWRELVFGDELLTGFISGSERPISRMSVAAFADMGYDVDLDAADPYTLPTFRELAEIGITEAVRICDLCRMARPGDPIVLDGS